MTATNMQLSYAAVDENLNAVASERLWLRADDMVPLAATWRELIQPFSEMYCLRACPAPKWLIWLYLSLIALEENFQKLTFHP
jgi:hypothetical protein